MHSRLKLAFLTTVILARGFLYSLGIIWKLEIFVQYLLSAIYGIVCLVDTIFKSKTWEYFSTYYLQFNGLCFFYSA